MKFNDIKINPYIKKNLDKYLYIKNQWGYEYESSNMKYWAKTLTNLNDKERVVLDFNFHEDKGEASVCVFYLFSCDNEWLPMTGLIRLVKKKG